MSPSRIAEWLTARIASRVGIAPTDIDPRERFRRYGIDSARGVALAQELSLHVGRPLPATLFWEEPTIERVVAFLTRSPTSERARATVAREDTPDDEPIAVVGLACRLPGAPSVDGFWRVLREGIDAIREVPRDRWNLEAYYSESTDRPGRMATRWGGFLDAPDRFDAAFFGISPREATQMDPQQRLGLELAWEALEHAGIDPSALRGTRGGVFLGVSWNDYATLLRRSGTTNITSHTATGSHYSIVANRISYFLGMEGPSLAVDTACSSSLVAVHLACRSLRDGESSLALAGGVNLVLAPDSTVMMSKFGAMAPDGRCKAFDAAANGYVRGEGGGIVVLKTLARAQRDGDRILAVVRGSAVNNDGFSNGLTAPNPAAQEAVLREAYRRARVSPDAVQYVEAHGTGTMLGDPIEVGALGAVLGRQRSANRALAIGSVKTNVGHLEAAAGIAGFAKVVLAMRHRELPASLHFHRPNPHIAFEALHVRVQSERGPWPSPDAPLVAGVSSFGFGGTNCHVVLEEAPGARAAVPPRTASSRPAPQTGDHGDGARRPVVLVFSGQGSQWPGMGRRLLSTEPTFYDALRRADEAIRRHAPLSVLDEIVRDERSSRLGEVDVVQPVLFAIQIAQAALLRSWGVVPDAVVGHSMGEIAAACVAGVLDLDDAALVVTQRSRLVRELASGAGAMALVELSASEVAARLSRGDGGVVVAAHNGPTSTVVAGAVDAVAELVQRLARDGVATQPIRVDYASHSPQMDVVRRPLLEALAPLRPRRGHTRFFSTVEAALVDGADCGPQYWAANIRRPVRFAETIELLAAAGDTTFAELGGHPILAKPVEQTLAAAKRTGAVTSMFRRDEDEWRSIHECLAQLRLRGVPADAGPASPEGAAAPARILVLSAHSDAALEQRARALGETVRATPIALDDLVVTASERRAHLDRRAAVVFRTRAELLDGLGRVGAEAPSPRLPRGPSAATRPVFVFQGHGGQWPKMGADLLGVDVFRASLEATDRVVRPLIGWSILRSVESGEAWARLDEIDVAQPLLFAFQIAIAALWRSWGIAPGAVVGHSVGEVAAAHVAGALSLEDAARVVMQRSRLMKRVAGRGAMALVELPAADVAARVARFGDALSIAGWNGPSDCVLSGTPRAIADILGALERDGIFCRRVNVDVASHSAQMEPLRRELVELVEGIRPSLAAVSMISTVTGAPIDGPELTAAYWGRNLRDPFRVADAIESLSAAGHGLYVEIGPHPLLTAAIDDVARRRGRAVIVVPSLRRDEPGRDVMLSSLGALYVAGALPTWRAVHEHRGHVAELPPYPWQRERFWPAEGDLEPAQAAVTARGREHAVLRGATSLAVTAGSPPTIVWEADLRLDDHPYLRDHVVQGEVTVPGVAQLELVLAAARRSFDGDVELRDVHFRNALFLGSEARVVQVTLRGTGRAGEFVVASRARSEADAWIVHATGAIATGAADVRAEAAPASLEAEFRLVDASGHYDELSAHGLALGATFRGIRRLGRRVDEVLVEATLRDELRSTAGGYEIHPAFLDALLQGIYAGALDDVRAAGARRDDTFIPTSVARFRMRLPPRDRLWSRIRMRPASGAESFAGDLRILDDDGNVVIAADEFRFSRLGGHGRRDARYALAWRRDDAPAGAPEGTLSGDWLLVCADTERSRVDAVAAALAHRGARVWVAGAANADGRSAAVRAFVRGDDAPGLELRSTAGGGARSASGIVYLGERSDAAGDAAQAAAAICADLLAVARGVAAPRDRARPVPVWVVTRAAHAVDDRDEVDAAQAALWGFARTLAVEEPESFGGIVDLGAASPNDASNLASVIAAAGAERQLALRGEHLYVPRLVRDAAPRAAPIVCRPAATYLVTGGLGGVGLEVARWLAARGARRIVLVSRRELPERARWAEVQGELAAAVATIRELEDAGVSVTVARTDVADEAQVDALVAELARTAPALAGVVHAAGVIQPTLIAELDRPTLERVLRAKTRGTQALHRATAALPLDFFVCFSTVQSLLPMRGQAAHAAANAFMDAFAIRRRREGQAWTSIGWGMWGRVGVAATEPERRYLDAHGFLELSPEDVAYVDDAIQARVAHAFVAPFDEATLRRMYGAGTSRERLFDELVDGAATTRHGDDGTIEAVRRASTPEDRRLAIAAVLRPLVAGVLGLDVERLEPDARLNALGLDSIMAAELRNRVDLRLGVRIQMLALLRGATTAELVAAVETQLGAASEPATTPSAEEAEASPLAPEARFEPFAFTDIQHAYWVGRQGVFAWGNVATHLYVEIDGRLDHARLEAALRRTIARHDMLRAVVRDGTQQVLPEAPPHGVALNDLSSCSAAEVERELAALRKRFATSAPPLDAWPHVEVALTRMPTGATRLHVNFDMLVVDAFSIALVFRDLGRFYTEPDVELPALDATFRGYLTREAALQQTPAAKRSEEYWLRRMHELPAAPQLPRRLGVDPERLKRPRFEHHLGELDADRWQALKSRAHESGLTPSTVLCAALASVLSHWAKEPRFTINLTQFRRFPLHPQVNDVVGDFTSTVLLGVDWSNNRTFVDNARALTEQLWTDMDHPHVSGVKVLRELSPSRREPVLMPVVFTSALGDLHPAIEWAGELRHVVTETSQVCLDNRVQEYRGALVYGWDTAEEFFPEGLLREMFASYERTLVGLAEGDPELWNGMRPATTSGGSEAREAANATAGPVPGGLLFEPARRHAHERPDAPAVIAPQKTLSYRDLFTRVTLLARALRVRGAAPNELIAIVMEKGWEQVVAALAILESGAAYVPIDAGWPTERILRVLELSGAKLALTQPPSKTGSAPWREKIAHIDVSAGDGLEGEVRDALAPIQGPEDLAYVIFTSGSTGEPKGVMIDHRGALNTCIDVNERFGIGPSDRVLALSNLSFDLSVYDVFGVLAAGGAIVLPPADASRDPSVWADLVRAHRVTIWNSVPALASMLVEDGGEADLASLRLVMMSGDWIPVDLPARIRRRAKNAALVSLGGATEASIWSILYPIGDVDPSWQSIPYGKPMRNQTFHVLDDALEPRPTWTVGHLYIGGIGLAKGYWGDAEKTAAAFIVHPKTGERLYRTGDLGRYLPDGNIDFLGREDGQVKINGHRIELGEIEATLRKHPDVSDSYVLVRRRRGSAATAPSGGKRSEQNAFLFGYVVAREGAVLDEADLRAHARTLLPEYMVPARILPIAAIPLSANGKVDRRALPNPDHVTPEEKGHVAPRTSVETAIAEIWAEALDLPLSRVGVADNFLDLGGNSVLLVRVSNGIAARLGVRVRITDLFDAPTIEGLAALLTDTKSRADVAEARALGERRRQLLSRRTRGRSE